MFDETPPCEWQAALVIGDIVRFRFPHDDQEAPGEAPKSRPCLVLETPRIGRQRFAKLVYGTGSKTRANRGCENLRQLARRGNPRRPGPPDTVRGAPKRHRSA